MERVATRYPEYLEIVQKLKSLLEESFFVDYYDYVEMAQERFEAIREETFQDGRINLRNSVVEKLKEKGVNDDEIKEIVGPDPRTISIYI